MAKHYGKETILLIDEYDVPLDKVFHGGYYTEMVPLICNLFGNTLLKAFCDALEEGKAEEVERLFRTYQGKRISIRDTVVRRPTKENFYHGILLGYRDGWHLKSNQEPGNGYSDILICDLDEDIGIMIEVKVRTGWEHGTGLPGSDRADRQE